MVLPDRIAVTRTFFDRYVFPELFSAMTAVLLTVAGDAPVRFENRLLWMCSGEPADVSWALIQPRTAKPEIVIEISSTMTIMP